MQLTGTITNIEATQAGGYQGRSGYIYTFDMSINTQQGVITGEIGSKSQTYPIAVGQPITVEQLNRGRGVEFKKINPQYQGGQQGGQQAGQRPNAPAGSKDTIIAREAAGNALGRLYSNSTAQVSVPDFIADIDVLSRYYITGKATATEPETFQEFADQHPAEGDGIPI